MPAIKACHEPTIGPSFRQSTKRSIVKSPQRRVFSTLRPMTITDPYAYKLGITSSGGGEVVDDRSAPQGVFLLIGLYFYGANVIISHLYGETVSWSLAIASTAQLAIGRGSTPLGDTFFVHLPSLETQAGARAVSCIRTNKSVTTRN